MTVSFRVSYDGETGAHTMDVALLAPALLSFGEMIREANSIINGDASRVQVNVVSDFENKCFNINFQVVQTLYAQIKTLLGMEDVKTAKEILEWLGILGLTPALGITLVKLLVLRNGKKISNVVSLTDPSKKGMVRVEFANGKEPLHLEVHQHVYNLGENKKLVQAAAEVVRPIKNDGAFDRVEFGIRDTITSMIVRSDAEKIQNTYDAILNEAAEDVPLTENPVDVWLKILSPVFDEDADTWRFYYGENQIRADISETDIAKKAIERGGATIDDMYRVKMIITQRHNQSRITMHYKIVEVLDFQPARVFQQGRFL